MTTGATRSRASWKGEIAFLASSILAAISSAAADEDVDFFEKRIRPIFVERCETCHSASTGKTNGGLALDTRDGWMKGGDSGSPIVVGKPDESLLIRAVRYVADGPQMPPKEKGGKLPENEIAALIEWVSRGASDPRIAKARVGGMTPDEVRHWWSFQPVATYPPPAVKNTEWPRTDLDRFILAELEQRNLSPAQPADRRTLLRRATFDLTGLPPTIDEIEAFVNDPAADAFARVIDRLLNSPAYGQRWARHWMDVARYADYYDANPKTRTGICELTEAWRYRDWVVDALNDDLPYDQFVQLQIAGDLLPNPNGDEVYPAGLIATTFLSNGVWDRGDADKEKIISDMVDDNIDTVGKAFLGLTLGCARCHDHKFDPVSTEDYYALAGIFYSTHILKDMGAKGAEYVMNRIPLVPRSVLAKREEQETRLKEVQAKIELIEQRNRYRDLVAGGAVLNPTQFVSAAGANGTIESGGAVLVSGPHAKDSYTITAEVPAGEEFKFVRLEALADPSLPGQGPGRAADGNFVVTRFSLSFATPEQPQTQTVVRWASAKADFEQKGFPIAGAIDDKPETGWAIDPARGNDHVAVFEIAVDQKLPPRAVLTFTIEQSHSDSHTLGKLRLSLADSIPAPQPQSDPERDSLIQSRGSIQQDLAVAVPVCMAVVEGGQPGGLFPNIQDVPIHIRGHYGRLGPVVARRFPRFLAGDNQPSITNGSGRRELAAWVASKNNPLTARVIVNRIWQWHFGEGLVRTTSNFGRLGEPPSHPQLIDWMAERFVSDGWSLKKLHKLIMSSAVYQQTSRVSREQASQDSENRWLGRFSSRRLEAEAIRDALLAVSGQLDPTAGGPAGDDFTILRRSLYVQTARWDRSGYAILFDAANPDSSTERRVTSTVAPQALLFLNHPFTTSRAQALANRILSDVPGDETAGIQYAFQLLFGRHATAMEVEIAQKIIHAGVPHVQAGWTDLAHVLVCSNEFIYLD